MMAGLSAGGVGDWAELTAALVLFIGSLIAAFTFWTLIAWGFTLTMLQVLNERRSLGSTAAWCSAATGGQGIEVFAADRCHLLIRVGLAKRDGAAGLVATALGEVTAELVRLMRHLFGLDR